MSNLDNSKLSFSEHLTEVLVNKYKKQISVVFFVNQFNLRAHGTNTIAYETGRKWLKGLAIPQTSKMKILIEWLALDPYCIFDCSLVNANIKALAPDQMTKVTSAEDSYHIVHYLQSIALELDHHSQYFLSVTALILREHIGNKLVAINYLGKKFRK
jgi:hypothetical protein